MEETAPASPKKTSTGKIVAFVGCGCLGLIALMVIGVAVIFFGVIAGLKKSTPYEETFSALKGNPEAIEALGEPIEAGLWMTGNFSIENGKGDASFTVPVSGPNGSGTLHIDAKKPGGSKSWIYDTRELRLDGDDSKVIPLNP